MISASLRTLSFVAVASLLPLLAPARALAQEPQISEGIDAGGHTGKIRQALFTRDGASVITVSEDKTVRVWNVADGTTRRVYRMPGTGFDEGRLFAAALSPDGQMLAVGGYGLNGGLHFIYLISLQTNDIVKVLNGHTDVIDALAFSPDGKKLLSGSHDRTARLWDVETRATDQVLTGHMAEVVSVAFAPQSMRAVTAAPDKSAFLWDLMTGKQVMALPDVSANVNGLAWSTDSILAGGEDGLIRLWSPEGMPKFQIETPGRGPITSVTLWPDGARGLFTQGAGQGVPVAGILDLGSRMVGTTFLGHNGPVIHGALSPDQSLAVTVGGDRAEAIVWKTTDGSVVQTLSSEARANWAVAWSSDGTRIGWGTTKAGPTLAADAPLERAFDLTTLGFAGKPDETYQRGTLKTLGVSFGGFEENTVLFENGLNDFVRVELPEKKDTIACVTVYLKNRAVVASQAGLYLFDTKSGKRLRDFTGHSGRVKAVSSSPDGKYLLSASDDRTLRIWDLEHDLPLLSILPVGEDWIAWTPEGYYACSPGGERMAGWRLDNGLNKVASFFPAILTRKSLYRPDVLKELLTAGSVTKAVAAAGGADETNIRNALPPSVQITAVHKPEGAGTEVTLEAVAIQQGSAPIVSMQVLVNGRPLGGRAGRIDFEKPAAQIRQDLPVTLVPGLVHELVVRADTAYSHGLSSSVTQTVMVSDAPAPRTLHVLAMGVSAYQDEMLKHETAVSEVKAIAEAFQQKSASSFDKVEVNVLTDGQATRAGVLSAVTALRKEMKPQDTAVVIFAGLSQHEDGGSFLLPHDADPSSLIVTAIPDSQLKSMLQGLPGQVLMVLDAPALDPATPSVVEDLARDLAHDDLGILTLGLSRRVPAPADKPSPVVEAFVEALSLAEGVSIDAELTSLELARHVRKKLAATGATVELGVPGLTRPWTVARKPQ